MRQGTRGTIAHEFQHMINAGNRFFNPQVSDFESSWLDEALAHFAEDAVGRVQRGFGDLQPLTFNDVLPCNAPCSQRDDFNAFFFQNLARLTDWMDHPDQYSPTSDLADTSLAVRGAAWAFVRYAADNYSAGLPRTLTHQLSIGPDTGVKNFTAATKAPIDTLVKGWLVSMYADHLGITGLDAKYQYRSYNFRSVMPPVAKVRTQSSCRDVPLADSAHRHGQRQLLVEEPLRHRVVLPAHRRGGRGREERENSGCFRHHHRELSGEHVYVLRVQ